MTSGARNCESFKSSQISALVPSPLGNLAAASRTVKQRGHWSESGFAFSQLIKNATKVLTQREYGDVWRPVGAEQRVLSGLVERHLLVEDTFDWPNYGFKAVHPEGEGFMRLIVPLLLLIDRQQSMHA